MYQAMLQRLLSFPQRGQIKIDFDLKKRIFRFAVPVFSSREIPAAIKNYIDARKNFTFKPHVTSFQMEGSKVVLMQELSFQSNFQETLRQQVDHFWKMSRQCHQMFSELAVEEFYKNALRLDSDF